MRPARLALAVTPTLAAFPALAADRSQIEARYSRAYHQCLQSDAGMSDPGMRDCTSAEIERQDARLNAAYKTAMGRLNARQQTALKTAQRAWIAYRDADCGSLYDDDWGTISRLNAMTCVLDRTIERTLELEHFPPDT